MLDLIRDHDPGVHALLVHRSQGAREFWVSERADRDRNHFLFAVDSIMNGRATRRTKMKSGLASLVPDPNVLFRLTLDFGAVSREACLNTEDATCSTLAGKQWQMDTRIGSAETVAVS